MRIRKRDVGPGSISAATGYSGTLSHSGDNLELARSQEGGASFWEVLDKGDLVLVEEPGQEATVATIEDVTVQRDVLRLRFHNGTGLRLFHCEDQVRVFKQPFRKPSSAIMDEPWLRPEPS